MDQEKIYQDLTGVAGITVETLEKNARVIIAPNDATLMVMDSNHAWTTEGAYANTLKHIGLGQNLVSRLSAATASTVATDCFSIRDEQPL